MCSVRSSSDDVTVRPLVEADEAGIVALHRAVFPHTRRTLKHQCWKYTDNPFGAPLRVGAFVGADDLAAHVAAYRVPLVRVRGAAIEDLAAQQIGDSMTDPRHRRAGHGRQGPFARAMQRLVDDGGAMGMDVVYGVAPSRLQRFYVRHIEGSEHLFDIPFVRADVRAHALAGSTASSARDRAYQCRPLTRGPECDAFFERVASQYGILAKRDARYLEWRYGRNPDCDYLLAAVYHRRDLVGWGAFLRREDELLWGDALFDPGHSGAAADLLGWVLARPQMRGVGTVAGWYRRWPTWWSEALNGFGLQRGPEPNAQSVISACYPALRGDAALTGDDLRREFYLTMADSDLF